MKPSIDLVTAALTEEAVDTGNIIEIGWLSFRALAIPADAPQVQIDVMRDAFFAGAAHLFQSILCVLDPDNTEPSERDLRRMTMIDRELKQFIDDFKLKHGIRQ